MSNENIIAFAKDLVGRYSALNAKLEDYNSIDREELVKISKEKAELDDIYEICSKLISNWENFNLNKDIIINEKDEDLRDLAKEENSNLQKEIEELEKEINNYLLPRDKNDSKNAIVEIRAGTGGEEAGLFAFDLFQMYSRYAERRKWKLSINEFSETGNGGVKIASFELSGKNVYSRMKFESGVHRVQRVPKTENSGRVHTSAATVAVLPEMEDVEVNINDKDLRIDVYRASGAGGQHVNKTESAIRITHIPSGLVVTCQEGRDQRSNKDKAMRVLKSRLFALENEKQQKIVEDSRRDQVGSGDRSEKIRTYNFPQNRITDHRIGFSSQNLAEVMSSGDLDDMIDALTLDYQNKIIEENKQSNAI